MRLLLWSSLCFAGLGVANLLSLAASTSLAAVDLTPLRDGVALASLLTLIGGFVWEA